MGLSQNLSGHDSGIKHADPIDDTVRTGEINIFKNTAAGFLSQITITTVRCQTFFINNNDLSRFHIPDKFRANRVKRTGFRCHYPCIVSFSNTEWFKAIRIPGCDQFPRAHDKKGIGSLNMRHGPGDRFFNGRAVYPFLSHQIGNDFRVNRCLENGTVLFQFLTQIHRVDQITIMGNSKLSFDIFRHQWLSIGAHTAARCRIPDMANGDISVKFIQIFRRKYLVDQSHILIISYISIFTYRNAAAFLTTVL